MQSNCITIDVLLPFKSLIYINTAYNLRLFCYETLYIDIIISIPVKIVQLFLKIKYQFNTYIIVYFFICELKFEYFMIWARLIIRNIKKENNMRQSISTQFYLTRTVHKRTI